MQDLIEFCGIARLSVYHFAACFFTVHKHCRRAADHQQNASCNGRYYPQRRVAPAHRAEYENQGRRRYRHDLSRGTGHRLSPDEYLFHLVQSFRRCVQHAVRLHLHPDAVPRRGMAVRGNVGAGRGGVRPVLQ